MDNVQQEAPLGEKNPTPAQAVQEIIPGPLAPLPSPIDWMRPVQTKHGFKVRIIAIDTSLSLPVIGVLVNSGMPTMELSPSSWHLNGAYGCPGCLDLENVPEVPSHG